MTLATPNNRYVNDEQVAQACAQMFSRIGITTKVDAMPVAAYFGKARNQEFGVALLGWGSLAARSRAALARADAQRRTRATARGTGRAIPIRRSTSSSSSRSRRSIPRSARPPRARRARSPRARSSFIPLHYQIVTWAMKRSLDYAARTDEFTFAHHFKHGEDDDRDARLHPPPARAKPARAVRHVGARLRRRVRDRQPDRHPHQSAGRPERDRARDRSARARQAAAGAVLDVPRQRVLAASSDARSRRTFRRSISSSSACPRRSSSRSPRW